MKTIRTVILCLCFLTIIEKAFSQNPGRVAIYASKSDFLIPYIKQALLDLKDPVSGETIFTEAKVLNFVFTNADVDKLMLDAAYYYAPRKKIAEDSTVNGSRDSIVNFLVGHEYFLLVNQNVLGNNIEFQFVLYSILKQQEVEQAAFNNFPFKNVIKPLAETNFFINITEPEYLTKLRNGIKSLIPKTNAPATFKVNLSGNINKISDNDIEVGLGDSVHVNIRDVYDQDHKAETLDFTLKVLSAVKSDNRDLQIGNRTTAAFLPKDTGLHRLVVSCNDGVASSYSDTFNIKVYKLPTLLVLKDQVKLVYTSSVFVAKPISLDIPFVIDPGWEQMSDKEDISFSFGFERRKVLNRRLDSIYNIIRFRSNKRQRRPYITETVKNGISKSTHIPYTYELESYDSTIHNLRLHAQEDYIDTLMNIYLEHRAGIKSNIEKVRITKVTLFPISIRAGVEFNSLYMRNRLNDTSLFFRYTLFTPVDISLSLLTFKKVSVNLSTSFGYMGVWPSTGKGLSNAYFEKTGYTKFGVGISMLMPSSKVVWQLNTDASVKVIPVRFDSANVFFRPQNTYPSVYGLNFRLSAFPEKLKGWGLNLYSGLHYSTGTGTYYSSQDIGFGVVYCRIKKD